MPRGGKREKAGRKSTWVSGCSFEDTKLIRVPKAIADEVLKIAHKLDAGEVYVGKASKIAAKPKIPSDQPSIICPKCHSSKILKDGLRKGKQRYHCKECGRKFMEHLAASISETETESKNLELFSN